MIPPFIWSHDTASVNMHTNQTCSILYPDIWICSLYIIAFFFFFAINFLIFSVESVPSLILGVCELKGNIHFQRGNSLGTFVASNDSTFCLKYRGLVEEEYLMMILG